MVPPTPRPERQHDRRVADRGDLAGVAVEARHHLARARGHRRGLVHAALLEDRDAPARASASSAATGAPPAPVPMTQASAVTICSLTGRATSAARAQRPRRRRSPGARITRVVAVVVQLGERAHDLHQRRRAALERGRRATQRGTPPGAQRERVEPRPALRASARRRPPRRSRAPAAAAAPARPSRRSRGRTSPRSRAGVTAVTCAACWRRQRRARRRARASASRSSIARAMRAYSGASSARARGDRDGVEVGEVEVADRVEDQLEDEVAGGLGDLGEEREVHARGVVRVLGGDELGGELVQAPRLVVAAALARPARRARAASARAPRGSRRARRRRARRPGTAGA